MNDIPGFKSKFVNMSWALVNPGSLSTSSFFANRANREVMVGAKTVVRVIIGSRDYVMWSRDEALRRPFELFYISLWGPICFIRDVDMWFFSKKKTSKQAVCSKPSICLILQGPAPPLFLSQATCRTDSAPLAIPCPRPMKSTERMVSRHALSDVGGIAIGCISFLGRLFDVKTYGH